MTNKHFKTPTQANYLILNLIEQMVASNSKYGDHEGLMNSKHAINIKSIPKYALVKLFLGTISHKGFKFRTTEWLPLLPKGQR
jgi:hypothetical protein